MTYWQVRAEFFSEARALSEEEAPGRAVFCCGLRAATRGEAEDRAREILPGRFQAAPAWVVVTPVPSPLEREGS